MNEEVIISIKGLRVTEDTDEDVEVITPGKYYLKNGKHYLLYDEIDEESGKTIKNMIKITSEYVEVTKRGGISSKLCFQEEKSYQSIYSTMFGEFLMETKTDAVMLDESDEVIEAMNNIGRAMPAALRETSDGGLAVTPTGTAIAERVQSL